MLTADPRPCCVCASSQSEAAFETPGLQLRSGQPTRLHRYRSCSRCGSYFIEALPSHDELAAYYESDLYHTQGADDAAVRLSPARRLYYDLVHRLGPGEGRHLLDIGCGPGLFLEHARIRGWDAEGAEFSDAAGAAARTRGFRVHSFEALGQLADASFDVVSMIHVLEHLPEPGLVLRDVARVLRPGGRVIVELPSLHNWEFAVFGAAHAAVQAPVHLEFFSEQGLQLLAQAVGLRVTSARNQVLQTLLPLSLLNLGVARRIRWPLRVRLNVALIPLLIPLNLALQVSAVRSSMRIYELTK